MADSSLLLGLEISQIGGRMPAALRAEATGVVSPPFYRQAQRRARCIYGTTPAYARHKVDLDNNVKRPRPCGIREPEKIGYTFANSCSTAWLSRRNIPGTLRLAF